MFAAYAFDSKIINDEVKSYGTRFVLPDAGSRLDRMVSKRYQMIDKFAVCYPDVLGESIHTAGNLIKDTTIEEKVV